jgi:CubicO group peptidase (beta-lactamase class C family)
MMPRLLAALALPLLFVTSAPPEAARPPYPAVDAAIRAGIKRGLYPGAVVIIGRHDRILYQRGYGHFTWSRRSPVPSPSTTLWDLASLSKVVGTTAVALRLVDQGKLELDTPVAHYLPAFSGGDKDRVTVRMLLDHTSGLRPFIAFYRTASSREEAITELLADSLRRPPGLTPEYSDLNAILLGLVLERVGGMPLDSLVATEVASPLGLRNTRYRPPPSVLSRIAPSSSFRGQPVAGVPNDQNAVVFGGVAGHAGLFSTGRDLSRYAQAWLRKGRVGKAVWVRPETMQLFLTAGERSGTRLLGWDSPDSTADGPTAFGERLSAAAYGHTGWTGTQIWIDPRRDMFMIFLTNRSFDPRRSRSLAGIRDVRSRLSNAVARLAPAN